MGTNKVALNAGHHVDIVLVIVNASFGSDIMNGRFGANKLRCCLNLFFGIGFFKAFATSDAADVALVSNERGRKRLPRNKR